MTWGWQQPYDAVLSEKDPCRLPERLMLAQKAILQRWQELPESAHELPEGQALREALNRLYALYPHGHHPPGQIPDEETDPTRRNWMRVAIPLALGLTLASAVSWMAARRNERIEARRMAAVAETQALRNSRRPIIGKAGEIPLLDAGSYEYSSPSAAAPTSRGRSSVTLNRSNGQSAGVQSRNTNQSPEAPTPRREASVVSIIPKAPDLLAKARGSVGSAPQVPADSAPSRTFVDDSAASAGRDSVSETDAEEQSSPSVGAEPRDESERPRGTVSVSASAYPSIRVPPDLQSQTVAGESLQIGESISRTAPSYPEEAEKQVLEGTVKLRALIGKDGAVDDVKVMSGPPLLASAAVAAVRQWRYNPTFLGDQPIEVAEDITIVFRLASPTDPSELK
jgi:TonB family protein